MREQRVLTKNPSRKTVPDFAPYPKTFSSLPRLVLVALFSLGAGLSSHATLPASPHAEIQASFSVGDIKADPVRTMVYLVDQTDNEILEIDTASGLAVKTVPIEDGSTTNNLITE